MTPHERIQLKTEELVSEFEALIRHPRIDETLDSYFLYDGEIKAPSEDLIFMLAGAILSSREFLRELNELESKEQGLSNIAAIINNLEPDKIKRIAHHAATDQVLYSLLHPDDEEGERVAKWSALIEVFREPEESIDRFVAKSVIDLLLSRALWHLDYQSIETLARVTKELATGSYPKTKATRVIMFEVLKWEPILSQEFGRKPTKTEIKYFILGLCDDISETPKIWSKAFKALGWGSDDDRKIKSTERDRITRLILSHRER